MQKLKCSDCESEELVFKREQRIGYDDYLIYECDDCGEEFSIEKERKRYFSDKSPEEFDRMVKEARKRGWPKGKKRGKEKRRSPNMEYMNSGRGPVSKLDVVIMYRDNPDITTMKVGKYYGVTRERVCQILRKHGIDPNARRMERYRLMRICPECGGVKEARQKVCSECYHSFHFDNFTCEICGVDFEVRKTEIRRRVKLGRNMPRFHNNTCRGIWTSRGGAMKEGRLRKSNREVES